MNRRTELQDALIGVLAEAGIRDYRVEVGKTHKRLCFDTKEGSRFYVFSGSPSDRRGRLNAIADLRRMVGRPAKVSSPRKRARTSIPRPARKPESFTTLPNGFDALKDHPALKPRPW